MKKFGIVFSIICMLIATFYLNAASSKWSGGIFLEKGWGGTCYGDTGTGFPFVVISCPPLGFFCPCSYNSLGISLNYAIWFLVVLGIVLVFYHLFKHLNNRGSK